MNKTNNNIIMKSKTGFTLVELLVVVGIIALLVAIIVPSLSYARESSKTVKCLNNLRQMTIAAHAYAQSYRGRYPIAYYTKIINSKKVSYSWDFIKTPDFSTRPPTYVAKPGILWQGETIEKIQQCPSFDGASNSQGDPFTGYNYNTSYIGRGQGFDGIRPAKLSDVQDPPNTALFGDGEYCSGANKYMRSPWLSPDEGATSFSGAGTQGYRHRSKTNVAFCDGRVSSWAERYTDTYSSQQSLITEGTGFLSSDNSMYDLE